MLQVADVRHRIGLELALADVAGTDPNRVELVEHVELGERNRTDTVEGDAVARHHAIEPSHPPRPTCGGAIFDTDLSHLLAQRIGELGWHRPIADPSGIRLENAHRQVDSGRRNPPASKRAAST